MFGRRSGLGSLSEILSSSERFARGLSKHVCGYYCVEVAKTRCKLGQDNKVGWLYTVIFNVHPGTLRKCTYPTKSVTKDLEPFFT